MTPMNFYCADSRLFRSLSELLPGVAGTTSENSLCKYFLILQRFGQF
jgi:hypothetical protein